MIYTNFGLSKTVKMVRKIYLIPMTLLLLFSVSCGRESNVVIVGGGNVRVVESDKKEESAALLAVMSIVDKGREAVDEIKRPVIGEAAMPLEKYIPESPLMNFAADALLNMAQKYSDVPVDIAITNKGGLRSNLPQGVITFGDIYNVFPFENTLAMLTLNGEQLLQLCREIASVGGEAVSGLELLITPDGNLLKATADGLAIEPDKKYRIATSDYLSQGNDKMAALALGTDRNVRGDITIRNLMVQYIKDLALRGEMLNAECDGRIKVKK